MTKIKFHIIFLLATILSFSTISSAKKIEYNYRIQQQTNPVDSAKIDSLENAVYTPTKQPTFIQKDRFGDPFSNFQSNSPLLLQDPSSLKLDLEIDTGMNYTIYEKIGDINYRPTSTMTFGEFNRYQDREIIKSYWKNKSSGLDGESAVSGRRLIPKIYISPAFDRIFGGSYVDIEPTGFVNLDFGGRWQRINNPELSINQQKNGGFNFDQQISMNVVGKVGEKLAITANFDNNNSFDFQNNLKVEYTGYEEDIIKKIEIGNVSMNVSNSLMSGGQSLFGIKTQLQFGKLFVTALATRQQSTYKQLVIDNGAVQNSNSAYTNSTSNSISGGGFEIRASDYVENRHFFLGHFFRDNYEQWHSRLPNIISSVNVTRLDVYVVNRNRDTETLRNVVGLMDLAEGNRVSNDLVPGVNPSNALLPNSNDANGLFAALRTRSEIRGVDTASDYLTTTFGMTNSTDYEITQARKLQTNEYTWNNELGYISLQRPLQNDEVLAVAYEYSYNGANYRVGELPEDYPGESDDYHIILKLLRPSKINTEEPTWDLMMKNIYNLNTQSISPDGFTLRIHYKDDLTGIDNPSLHEGANTKDIPLIEILGLDRLNVNGDPQKDANFDYIPEITIDERRGNVIFPVLEPFGRTLESKFTSSEQTFKDKYVFDTLYRDTQVNAAQIASLNKFFIVGTNKSSSSNSEYNIPAFNVNKGSVVVKAGNTILTEGLHYTIDTFGKVRIIDEGIANSGKQITIDYESPDLFNFQTKWLTGARLDYRFNEKTNFGATILHLNERPGGISRFSVGDEPLRNTKYGFDFNFQDNSRKLTKIVDALPLINTKEESSISFNAEFAQLIPGTSNKVNGEGTSYIDDFENATTPYNLGGSHLPWKLGATPTTSDNRFNHSASDLSYAFKRAKIAWYIIDNTFYRSGGNKPDNISDEDLQNNYSKAIIPQDIFRARDRQVVNTNEPIFDIAYFPSERGPYNYNPDLTSDGLLPNPSENFGAITRANTTEVNWEETNVEYVEFWMMDPFITGQNGIVLDGSDNPTNNTTGGQLIFNFGSVSEDVMKDNRYAFEQGLPSDGSETNTISNQWGKVSDIDYLTDFFDNTASARVNQDIGLDGLKSSEEEIFFNDSFLTQINPQALQQVIDDVSADDFEHFFGDNHDNLDNKIVERYKNFNGMEGNSPVQTGNQSFSPSSSNIPDKEDLNSNNNISDLEEFFEYKIDLRPGQLEVNKGFIVDKVTDLSGTADWYLFRIPVKDPDRVIGKPQLNNMKYYRVYLTGWSQPVVLRMAKFQTVGAQWRKSTLNLNEKGFNEIPESGTSDFDVSVVNIEENSVPTDGKSPYVIPPGLDRDLDTSSAIARQSNEQSLKICVEDLEDGDARAVFKNTPFNLIRYGRLRMFLHAELNRDPFTVDDDVSGFLRLGSDQEDHYYEIEVPLKITPNDLTEVGDALRRAIWPLENEIDISIDELLSVKSRRNRGDFDVSQTFTFPSVDGKYKFTVKGNPDISAVQTIMIGVRNPKTDDLQAKSVCIWANEMRVSDFDTQKGWAANARVSAKLADFATVNASTRYTSVGFGGIQDKIAQRTINETTQYDVSANVNLDKLLPAKTGLKIPMFVSFEKSITKPKFDPLDPDSELEVSLLGMDGEERSTYENLVQDRTTRKSINFTNVRKEKVKADAKSHIYDIENFSFNYSFSESNVTNINTESFLQKQVGGGFAYNYSPQSPSIEPFKNSKALSGNYLQLIKDINISLLPNNLSMRADLDRRFTKRQLRNGDLTTEGIDPYFEKYFNFDRSYNLRWNIFKSLSLDYTARANAIIDEPEGDLDSRAKRDSVWNNLKNLGRLKRFDQTFSANYRLPLDKIPITDWVSADLRYSAGYNWDGASFDQIDEFGNTIGNNRDKSATGKVDLVRLYNKVGFLKEINTPARRNANSRTRAGSVKKDTTATKSENKLLKGILRLAMSVRSINLTYNNRQSTTLPGFRPRAYLFGLDSGFNAPGLGFIFGSQDPNIRIDAANNGWLVESPFLTTAFRQNLTQDIGLKASIEPAKDIKIQLDLKRSSSGDFQEIFRFDTLSNEFRSLTPSRSGSYNITFMSIATAFQKGDSISSPTFTDFENYRAIIQDRLNIENASDTSSYGLNSQDVLIPAFIAAYSGKDPNSVTLSPFPKIPLPNWRIDYAGLSKIPALSDIFSSINITHAYSSTFSVSNYTNSTAYNNPEAADRANLSLDNDITNYPKPFELNDNGELIPVYIISDVTISERFSPLIGINVRTKGRTTAKIEWKKERNLSLNLSNSQMTELSSNDISFDFGFTKEKMKLPFKANGRTLVINNDVQFRMTFTIRDTETIQRKLDDVSTITNGNINYQIRPTLTYSANNKLNLTMYFERNINSPRVSNSFDRATTAFGVQMRFSLAQ